MPARAHRSRQRHPTPSHLARRVKAAQQRLKTWAADALLLTNPRDIRYLTGFVGDDSWAVLAGRGDPLTILTDFRFTEQAAREAPHVPAIIRDGSLADALVKHLAGRGLEVIAAQAGHLTVDLRDLLLKKLAVKAVEAAQGLAGPESLGAAATAGAARLRTVDDGLLTQRAVKDAVEVAAIRRALAIQQKAFQATLAFIRPGRSEQEIAAHLEHQMRSLGADKPSFDTIVAADANASLPHAIPGPARMRQGGIVLVDWGARYRGYCSDLTRVVALGKMPAKMAEVYRIVLEAQLAGIAAIAPGKSLRQVDEAARKVIRDAGYGEQFGHSLGHGVGLDIHEQPTLSARSEGVLQPGQVVTVEPGIYLPGVGGVRIEDDVLVTARGAQVLSDLPKDLPSAMIRVS